MKKAVWITIAFAAAAAADTTQFKLDRNTPICDKAHLAFGEDKGVNTLVYCVDPPKNGLKGIYVTPQK